MGADAATIYERFFVPALFGQYAEPLLARAGVAAGDEVLDVGCGTGVVGRTARRRGAAVVGVDPNPAMLAVARRCDPFVRWQTGSAESLPFPGDVFDHTVAAFCAMFFTDITEGLREMLRVTRPGGTITLATWAGLDRSPGYAAMVGLVAEEVGNAAAEALRAPFVLGDEHTVRDLFLGLDAEPSVEVIDGQARFSSLEAWVRTDVRGWTLSDLVDERTERALLHRARGDLAGFVAADGGVAFPAPAIVARVIVPG